MIRATFARRFLLHVGKPFPTFLNQVHFKAVCQALLHPNEHVHSITSDHRD